MAKKDEKAPVVRTKTPVDKEPKFIPPKEKFVGPLRPVLHDGRVTSDEDKHDEEDWLG